MRAANCVWFCLNPFCCEVHEGCLLHDNTSHQLGLEVERPEEHYILLFLLFYMIKETFLVLANFFSLHIQSRAALFMMKFPTHVNRAL